MKHIIHYNNLIATRQHLRSEREISKNSGQYFENHHIIPKCLGGSNDADNLVLLTAREHLIAHLLLWKIYGGKLFYAIWRMTNSQQSQHYKINSRLYEQLKIQQHKNNKRSGKDHWNYGKQHTLEAKAKMREAKIGKTGPRKGCKLSEETKQKLRDANTGKKLSKETKQKISKHSRTTKNPQVAMTQPFQHVKFYNNDHLCEVWLQADLIYTTWKTNQYPGFVKLSKLLFKDPIQLETHKYQIRKMISWFKTHGDPMQNQCWLQWVKEKRL